MRQAPSIVIVLVVVLEWVLVLDGFHRRLVRVAETVGGPSPWVDTASSGIPASSRRTTITRTTYMISISRP
jgi:hypothetical protein